MVCKLQLLKEEPKKNWKKYSRQHGVYRVSIPAKEIYTSALYPFEHLDFEDKSPGCYLRGSGNILLMAMYHNNITVDDEYIHIVGRFVKIGKEVFFEAIHDAHFD